MPIMIGQKEAKCPGCGGTNFAQVPTGKVIYLLRGADLQVSFKAKDMAFLCTTLDCHLRPWTMLDLKNQESDSGNGDAVIQP